MVAAALEAEAVVEFVAKRPPAEKTGLGGGGSATPMRLLWSPDTPPLLLLPPLLLPIVLTPLDEVWDGGGDGTSPAAAAAADMGSVEEVEVVDAVDKEDADAPSTGDVARPAAAPLPC